NFQWAQDRLVVQWFEQFKSSSVTNDRIKNLEKQYALEDIRRYVFLSFDLLLKMFFFL
ncbi:unnamed protein product, partial [Rotaria magnacalcarata]